MDESPPKEGARHRTRHTGVQAYQHVRPASAHPTRPVGFLPWRHLLDGIAICALSMLLRSSTGSVA